MSESLIFRVSGYRPVVGNKVEYYRASSEARVMQHIKATGPEAGGFVTYSVEEVDVLPLEVNIACPSCGHDFESPDRVTRLK